MIEINVPKSNDGYIYTIKSVEENCVLQCPSSCWYRKHGETCSDAGKYRELGIRYEIGRIYCIKVLINVKNTGTNENWVVGADDIYMVDSEGFAYNGIILCDEMLSLRISKDGTKIFPGTQLNYIQLFPQLPDGVSVSEFKVNIHNIMFSFNISEGRNKVENLSNNTQNPSSNTLPVNTLQIAIDFQQEIRSANDAMDNIRTYIYSLMNNNLTQTERKNLENNIRNKIFYLKIKGVNDREETVFKKISYELKIMENMFKDYLKEEEQKEAKRRVIERKIDELILLSPREFEEYIYQLYKSLGYSVELTPYSNDKGVDIVMTLDETKYVVQCKRYKKTVGSPDIQKFIGSIDHFNADKGIFVTTGLFSFEAEKMAAQHPIELVNRVELAKLILKAINGDMNI